MSDLDEAPWMPFLYILMRTDLESMNPGKAVAQGSHAANQFVHDIDYMRGNIIIGDMHTLHEQTNENMYQYWKGRSGDGFGTTICLDVNDDDLHRIVEMGKRMRLAANITHDPSYPIRDGDVTHFIPLDTCGYIFGDKDDMAILLRQFDLMP